MKTDKEWKELLAPGYFVALFPVSLADVRRIQADALRHAAGIVRDYRKTLNRIDMSNRIEQEAKKLEEQ